MFHDSRRVVPWGTREREGSTPICEILLFVVLAQKHKTNPTVQSLQFVKMKGQRMKLKQ